MTLKSTFKHFFGYLFKITLLADIIESFLHAVIPSSHDISPPTPVKQPQVSLQRTVSMTSSSAVEQLDNELESHSESSSSFSNVKEVRLLFYCLSKG